ncbi:MAG TPA: tripartite tricarboxylate transporter substrate binding protein [Pyrinomonadaceae bacterium]|nr:tripartite tricarboxylate transporter substrate binding protein [Pyrinomonadaceae bacterium]
MAGAQTYPSRPIKLVIPYPPGGVQDAVGRPWGESVKARLGTVVIENIGGAGGALGGSTVKRAQPDGYTLLLGNGSVLVINTVASSRPPYHPTDDFEPISLLGFNSLAIAVNSDLPTRTLGEFVALVKANPSKMSYGSNGVGSLNHLTGELFKSLIHAEGMVHVPYRGAAAATTDVIGGQIPMAVAAVNGQLLELHRTGKLRILAITSPRRLAAAPDIPTAIEAGLPGLLCQGFSGLFAPKGTPRSVIDRISQETGAAMADVTLQKTYLGIGVEPSLETGPAAMKTFLDEDIARWTPVIKSIGLKLD